MKTEKNIFIAFLLNFAFSAFELFGGIFTGSIAILSDAVHDLGDALSIGLSWIFEKVAKRKPDDKFTYGYGRFSVLGGLITSLVLIVGAGIAVYNAVVRFIHPSPIHYDGMILFAVVGLVVNFVAALFTKDGHSLNQKAVNLHMLEDVLGWAIVLIGGIVMKLTGFVLLDGILSIIVAVYILFHACGHLREIADIFLLKTPQKVDVAAVRQAVLSIDGVEEVHHVHLWTIDGQNLLATMHVVSNTDCKKAIKEVLHALGVYHTTIEQERVGEHCHEPLCNLQDEEHAHHHGHCHGHHH